MAHAFARFFSRDDTELDKTARNEAEAIVAFANTPYYPRLLGYLAEEADRPMRILEHGQMIVAATRANTFKEILQHLRQSVRQAQELLDAEREK